MSRSRRMFSLGLFRRRNARADMRDELAFHLEGRIAQLVARGYTPDDARTEALRRLGGSIEHTERYLGNSATLKERRLDVRDYWHDFIDDIRYALRGLARSPGFTIVAVLTLAIGIGANTAIYSAVDALLLRALPFAKPEQLVSVTQYTSEGGDTFWSYPKYVFFRDAQKSYSSVAIYASYPHTLTENDPERVRAEEVTGKYLATLGINVQRGRDFPSRIDSIGGGAPRYALITDALWQRRYNADPDIVGKSVHLDNQPWEVVGVLPPGFRGISGQADMLINLSARQASDLAQAWSLEFAMLARLKPGATAQNAATEAAAVAVRMQSAFPAEPGTLSTSKAPDRWSARVQALNAIRVSKGLERSLTILFGAVAMVLLIACVNLANLLVARGIARRREIAVRLAIGARRGRLVRLFLTESIVLALLGGVASIAVAYGGTQILSAINPRETLAAQNLQGGIGAVGFENIHLDARAMLFTFGVTLLVGVLFGLFPAVRSTRSDLSRDLKDGSASAGSGRGVSTARHMLVLAEVALAVVLLAGSGLMLRSLGKLLQVNTGFDGHDVVTLRLTLPPGNVAPDSMPGFYDEIQRAIAGLPGVQQVALTDCAPLSGGCNGTIMTFADRPRTANGNAMVGVHWVSPSWFSTVRVPLKRGRYFEDSDRLNTQKVVVINEEAARRYFPGEDPIGKTVAVYQGGFHTGAQIVGIVGDVLYGTIDSTARPETYISYGQARVPRMMIFARTSGNGSALIPAIRATLKRVAPKAPVYDIMPMEQRAAAATAFPRFGATLLGLFAVVALSLAVMGIYGVMTFGVAQRTREMGIRMALGADGGRLEGLVMREGAALAAGGIVLGLGAALGLTSVLKSMLFEVTTTDPLTYAGIVLIVAGALIAASWVPARRAAKLEPVIALRRG